MSQRRTGLRPDTSDWPEFDPGTLTAAQRKTFGDRRHAVELFVRNTSLAEIEAQTGVNRRQVYRALESAAALHADGRPYGWRALVPHTGVGGYHRLAKVHRHPVGLGTAGALVYSCRPTLPCPNGSPSRSALSGCQSTRSAPTTVCAFECVR